MSNASFPVIPSRLFSVTSDPKISVLQELCSRSICSNDYPLCERISKNVPIYNVDRHDLTSSHIIPALQDEWHHILLSGPGVFVLKGMYKDAKLIDKINQVFSQIISSERSFPNKGDHFSRSGENDRIWDSFSKHGLASPSTFLPYYSNPWLALVCNAWLGPAYRITAQANIVKPGGQAQICHRDYHLGFQTADQCAKYPRAAQIASQLLTLQGAVAHTDMPLESGPTRLLPFSQLFEEGYIAYRHAKCNDFFLNNHVSLPLEKGDGIFFSPALFHAAGENMTDTLERSANLLQVSSAFGKPMEKIESIPLIGACWGGLRRKYAREGMSMEVRAFIAAVADGYAFPTNLDNRPPGPGGMAPTSQQDVLIEALEAEWVGERVLEALRDNDEASRPKGKSS